MTRNQQHGRRHKGANSIKGRWFLNNFSFIAAVIGLTLVLVGMASANYYYTSIRTNVLNRSASTASFFNKYMTKNYDQFYQSAQRFVNEFAEKDKLEIQIIDAYGRVLLSSSGLTAGFIPATADVDQSLTDGIQWVWFGVDPLSGERVISVSSPVFYSNGKLLGAVRYVSSLSNAEKQILMVIVGSALIFALFLLFLFISSRYFIKSIVEPVAKINNIAKEIAAGRYGMRLQKIHDDEIGDLCDTINYMSDEIARAEKMKNDFISSVSHELRTPLTAIAGWSETLISGGTDDHEEVMLGLDIIQRESRRLTQMVEELLEFARLENGGMRLVVEPFDLSREVYDAVYMYGSMLKKDGFTIDFQRPRQPYYVSGDRYRLKQVVLNVLDNAAKYGKEGKKVVVTMGKTGDQIFISVRDFGVGIKEDELPFVKQKFYKGSSKQRGSGIGLAVTDEIMRLHGGQLDIDSKYGEGTLVTIYLPAMDINTEIEE